MSVVVLENKNDDLDPLILVPNGPIALPLPKTKMKLTR